jgi:acyl phosphate:glycerol-3-phosphate acyltransferase
MEFVTPILVLLICLAYLIGSIPCGLLLGKAAGLGDIRTTGSGNIGATNMVRAGGKKLGVLTLLLDALKGIIVVSLTYHYLPHILSGAEGLHVKADSPSVLYFFGLIAVIGHCFPLWLRFKGGKGVATTLGVIGAVHIAISPATWWWLLPFAVLWIGTYKTTRYVSLASLVTFAFMPFFTALIYGIWLSPLLLTVLIFIRHKGNIQRLLNGTEHGFK